MALVVCCAIDGAGESHAHVDSHARTFHDSLQGRFVGVEREIGEEAE